MSRFCTRRLGVSRSKTPSGSDFGVKFGDIKVNSSISHRKPAFERPRENTDRGLDK